MKMRSSNKRVVQLIVEVCVNYGVKDVVVSPGSRNAPLVIGFDEHPEVSCITIHDERSAGFFGLGIADQTQRPVVIVCTSGSAAANYYPAVVEAYYRSVSLIVITADRPSAWVDQGDGQTINQASIFGKHVRYSCNLQENESADVWEEQRELSTAMVHATNSWKGPVHINVGFNEPLYGTAEIERPAIRGLKMVNGQFDLSVDDLEIVKKGLQFGKKMLLCGQLTPKPLLNKLIAEFADDSSVVVLVENTSNLTDKRFVHCIDRVLNSISEKELDSFKPELLITIGGAVVSKRIKKFLRESGLKMHWKIGHEFPFMDTYMSLTHSFRCDELEFFSAVSRIDYRRSVSNYGSAWKQKDLLIKDKETEFFGKIPFSDLKVFELILDYIPDGAVLHMANSSVVRYCQLFDPVNTLSYYSNRGASGIDGSSSTAAGAAYIDPDRLHVLVTGDVSFLYDSNAFWNKYLGKNLRIVVVNNGGGGIFNIIPGPSSVAQNESYFVAAHNFEGKEIAGAFNIDYKDASGISELESMMQWFYLFNDSDRPKMIEIFTPSDINHSILEEYFQFMK